MLLYFQTSQLPLDDRTSISYKEYLAEIDVCMGGRVAEELSTLFITCLRSYLMIVVSLWKREYLKRSQLGH